MAATTSPYNDNATPSLGLDDGCTLGDSVRPLRDLVCDELRARIVSGRLEPGSRLVEDRLAVELGVSRNPVREAMRVLESEGFISMMPRRGAVVAELTDEDANDIFDIRLALEALAARLAAKHCTDDHSAHLLRIVDWSTAAAAAGDAARVIHLNTVFHNLVCEIAGNKRLYELMKPLRGRTESIFATTAKGPRAAESVEEHAKLAAAITAHRPGEAARLAERHITEAKRAFRPSHQLRAAH